jgi:thiosulfate/3-mercaptopyruvate sulfurtransferase
MTFRATATMPSVPARSDVLVSPQWLEEHFGDPSLRLIEVDVSPAPYETGHIEGAVLWNVYQDFKDTEYRPADKATIEHLVRRSGIDEDSTIVLYGLAPAMGFWLMKLYRHTDVRILNAARDTWRREGRPWTTTVPSQVVTAYALPDEDHSIRAECFDVERSIGHPSHTLLDVRSDLEYRGERFWPSGGEQVGGRAGHVPCAVNLSIETVLDERGSYRSPAEIQRVFASIDLPDDQEVTCYCTIGGRASTAWFALHYLLGRQHVRVYDGSWAEWGLMTSTPVESG